MTTDEILCALDALAVQTGSLACLGCGHEHNCGIHGCAIIREAGKIIRWLSTDNTALREKMPQWISVEERPQTDHSKKCLITFKDSGGSIVDAAWYIPGLGWECCNWDVPQDVITHWMPLPGAPEV